MRFAKYQATGNDFVLVDNRTGTFPRAAPKAIRKLCQRRIGVGADGLIAIVPKSGCDYEMIYYNSDGHEATFCGNGARCAARFAVDMGLAPKNHRFWAADGEHRAYVSDETVRVSMAFPRDYRLHADGFFVDTGSPHFVVFVEDVEVLDALNVSVEGERLRYDARWAKYGGVNVNFVGELDTQTLFVRTFERGVEAETLSCGTGVTAAAYVRLRRDGLLGAPETIRVRTPGGLLSVVFGADGRPELEGPAVRVFDGDYPFVPDAP
jgi:diaminopimelate epimerase